ncbi:SulP family inorganic anion transporter [Spirulina major CS-329]|uniref:bicarbonate transporter BicA n=1 Tax=Spirulina TaxID=1154 RepID=UPI00232A8583|nr:MULTISPECIES: SulP family inorganic anion transporter [Spirulina]MDB9494370.1 SulP family inorganic anion transporter [Spirulina subsalsa CS-330]MDB9501681.1 SulP family inorganic anion transporter [Spirulina major CS-329]
MQLTNTIHFKNVQGDIFGGLTAAVIALPMALAFGVASGAGASAGLWGAVLVGFFAALFGGTPTLISEPTGPMTVVMTAVIAHFTASDPENGLAMAFTVVMMAGLFQILFGFLRLGRYITLMPYTVISGFMSGIGIILIILQTAPFLGQASPKGGVVGTIRNLPELLGNINPSETILAAIAVALLYFTPKAVRKVVPPQLISLIVGTVVALIFFHNVDIRVIGEIPMGLPKLHVPVFSASDFRLMLVDSLLLAMLGCIDALLTSLVADSLTRTEHNSDKELIGQGLGNLMSGLFGGIAGAGATMGTVVNIKTGGRTALSGLTRALILFVIVAIAAPLVAPIPLAVLAGIAIKVGIDIVDWSFLKRAHKVSPKAAFIMYGVILLTVFVDLIVAVGVGVFVANILTIERLTKLQSQRVKTITDADDEIILSPTEMQILDRAEGRILLFHLSGPMIFGVSKAIAREHNAIQQYESLVLDLSDVPVLGVTSSLAIENAINEAIEQGRHVFIVGATGSIQRRLEKLGILDKIPTHHLVMQRQEALVRAMELIDIDAGDDVLQTDDTPPSTTPSTTPSTAT